MNDGGEEGEEEGEEGAEEEGKACELWGMKLPPKSHILELLQILSLSLLLSHSPSRSPTLSPKVWPAEPTAAGHTHPGSPMHKFRGRGRGRGEGKEGKGKRGKVVT